MRELFPPIKPYGEGRLKVSRLHTLYYEECANPKGRPLVLLHGGPGGGIDPIYRRYFHPRKWRVVLFDQRGCGKSAPHGELRENTTWDLVADIERLREHLGIGCWTVFGGSWGSTLALAYAQTHPQRCAALILRGIFLLTQKELGWFYQEGANFLFPEAWEDYLKPIPPRERGDTVKAYYRRLTSPDRRARLKAARAWSLWEGSTLRLRQDPRVLAQCKKARFAEALARIECHYFVNKGFLKKDGQLLEGVSRIRHLAGVIVQGRYDVICPPVAAWELSKAWPKAKLVIVPDAGHSMAEPGIRSALIEATERFARP